MPGEVSEPELSRLLRDKFGFDSFRPSQEAVCLASVAGEDVLLVMPTGAGKSLCYQLPGLARKATTLVISPLLALIDDQAAKLCALGLRAEQIHSGRTREDSRQACVRYLRGELDFLFVAPERLAVPGFPEMLARRKPSLIAIDEAHCISQWGHDFRPEYRRLGERLEQLRPSPVMALTATATTAVQDDIVRQLGIPKARRFIQGFRRTNIGIQVLEVPPSSRGRACVTLLKGAAETAETDAERGKIPAIVYAQTRKAAEEIAQELKGSFRAESYHAGMTPDAREDVQTRFLAGDFEVIVATVAFGMGIDKSDIRTVIHAGLPGSVEGYYQEIGRAGRDGLPSQALLLHSFADRKTHDFFFERDYPETETLQRIYDAASEHGPLLKDELRRKAGRMEADVYESALKKLRIHGGAAIDRDDHVTALDSAWRKTYERQRSHREQGVQQMASFVGIQDCRMLFFLKHFGDTSDRAGPCGKCDRCTGGSAQGSAGSRPLTEVERSVAAVILAALSETSGISAGRLFEEVERAQRGIARRNYEAVLELLARSKWVAIRETSFEKGSETITYRKVELREIGRSAGASDLDELRITASPWMEGGAPKRSKKNLKSGSKPRKKRSFRRKAHSPDKDFSF